jgi:acetoin utilization protein AcuC
MRRARLVDARRMPTYDLGPDHPFAPFRQEPLADLIEREGLVRDDDRIAPASCSIEELCAVHDRSYVELLARLDDPTDREAARAAPIHGMGTADNPIRPGQHRAAAAAAGGTIACVDLVLRGEADAAFNPTGGLHHAMPAAASGFCLYNDLALGILAARRHGLRRIAYVDFDVHHGDGVEWIFREDPDVLTISYHEAPERRWPFTGRTTDRGRGAGIGSALNVPLAPGTTDASFEEAVERTLVPALERFAPELILTQHGCDPHFLDPLADLSLTTRAFAHNARLSRQLAERLCAGRWVATGGGGYQPIRVLPRAWTIVWCAVAGLPIPERLTEDWIAAWQERAGPSPLPATYLDAPIDEPRAAQAAAANVATVDEVLRLHGL